MQAFPYEDYKAAIEAESGKRAVGLEATVLAVEGDESREGCFVFGLLFNGRLDESLYENGSVALDGVRIGRIVAFADDDSGMVVVKAGREHLPSVGSTVMLTPADYLEPLREFAATVAEKPESRNEARFLSLREHLLEEPDAALQEEKEHEHLRWAQDLALRESVRRDFSLLWGPPGTGKSYTLGHIAAHYRAQGLRVLVLSTTNAAVDVATFAIDDACARCGQPLSSGELVRYTQTLTNQEEYNRRRHLMEYTLLLRRLSAKQREVEKRLDKERSLLAKLDRDSDLYVKMLLKVSGLVEEVREIGRQRKEEVAAMLAAAKIVCCTVTSCLYNGFASGAFDVVLVDEASQISLAAWPCLMNKAGGKKFVVAGDPMQLSPVQARDTDVGTQFWFDLNIYAYLGMTTFRGIEPFYDAGAMTLLNEQSRMRKGICDVVSKMFYNGLLVGDRADAPISLSDAGLPDGDVVVADVDASEELFGFDRLPESSLRKNANLESAGTVLKAVREIVRKNPPGRRLDILIVTPFRDQAKKVYASRIKTIAHGGDVSVRVSTVHSCQGGEADVVFFDLVNPLSGFLRRDDAAHLWCVACSRARQKLVVVGSVEAMRVGHYSRALLKAIGWNFQRGHRSDPSRTGIRAGSRPNGAERQKEAPAIRRFEGSAA